MSTRTLTHLRALSCLVATSLVLSALSGCNGTSQSQAETNSPTSEIPTMIHQAGGPDLMVINNLQTTVGAAKQEPLPTVLDATGQVTFDDKLVSTIISRLTGRIEEMTASQWQTVHRGELVMKVYSPDYMSAEAEYLAASTDGTQSGQTTQDGAFGIPAFFSVSTSLREAAIRKLELLGFTKADIAGIHTASPSVWVRAPISGIIVSKNVVRGQAVNPGDQLLALATLQRVWITADIYQDEMSRVWVGQSLEANTASFPGEVFKGTVERISPALDPNIHTLQLRCQVDNPGSLLKPQMLARVHLKTNPRMALVIPWSALVFDDHAYYAFIVEGADKVERRQVEIADWDEDGYTRIVNGIKPGEKFLMADTLKYNAMWHAAQGSTP